jgi:Mg/Co/Ni transporter MgtE
MRYLTHFEVAKKLRWALQAHRPAEIRNTLLRAEPTDAALGMKGFDYWHQSVFLELLPASAAAAVFEEMPLQRQSRILVEMSRSSLARILGAMPPASQRFYISLLSAREAQAFRMEARRDSTTTQTAV